MTSGFSKRHVLTLLYANNGKNVEDAFYKKKGFLLDFLPHLNSSTIFLPVWKVSFASKF